MMVINYYDELYMYCEVFCIQYYEIPCICYSMTMMLSDYL